MDEDKQFTYLHGKIYEGGLQCLKDKKLLSYFYLVFP